MNPVKLYGAAEIAVFKALLSALEEHGEPVRTEHGLVRRGRAHWDDLGASYDRMENVPDGNDDASLAASERHSRRLVGGFQQLKSRGIVRMWGDWVYLTLVPVVGFHLPRIEPDGKPRLRLVHSTARIDDIEAEK